VSRMGVVDVGHGIKAKNLKNDFDFLEWT